MNIRKNQAIILAIEAGVFLLSLLCLCVQKCSSFVGYSRVGVIVLLIDMLLFCKVQKKIITVQTLFLGMFILFQFGLPIIYAFSPKHYNFYLSIFDEKIITTAVKYTVMAIQLYIIVATFVVASGRSSEKPGKQGKWARIMLTHTKDVENAGLLLFAVTAVVAVPVNLWAAAQALTAEGDIGNLYRGAMSANGLTRFMQEFFFSSALLYLCFSRKKIGRKMVTILYFTGTFAPSDTPINRFVNRLINAVVEPTAANAWLPVNLPTTIISTALNKSCKMLESIRGKAKEISLSMMLP